MTLMVDDDSVFVEDAKAILKLDAGIFFATNGQDAMAFVRLIDFSVAIVDLDLRGESGFDVIRDIRLACPALPIIAISGVHSRAVLESAKVVGAVEVLEKPVRAEWKPVVDRLRQESRTPKAGGNC